MDDMALLREYAASNSETAFAELVSRRIGFRLFVGAAAGARPAYGRGNHAGGFHHPGAKGRADFGKNDFDRLVFQNDAVCRAGTNARRGQTILADGHR